MRCRVLPTLVAAAAFGLVPAAIIGLVSCSSSSAPAVLGDNAGMDTGALAYDGTMSSDDTGATSADTGARDAGELDSGEAGECGAGLTLCGLACVDLTTNPNNCGACSSVCAGAAMVVACCASKCVDNATDPNNCGGCGIVCDAGTIVDANLDSDVQSDPCVSGLCH